MDDVFEQVLVKKSDELHSQIRSLIKDLGDIIHDNELYSLAKIERSKVIFSSLQWAINEFESSQAFRSQFIDLY